MLKIGKTNVSIGNAGMLPATASLLIIILLTFHKLVLMELNSLDNAKNNSLNYGVNLDWTVLTALNVRKTRAAERITKQGEAQLK
jgi:hypothetical protein